MGTHKITTANLIGESFNPELMNMGDVFENVADELDYYVSGKSWRIRSYLKMASDSTAKAIMAFAKGAADTSGRWRADLLQRDTVEDTRRKLADRFEGKTWRDLSGTFRKSSNAKLSTSNATRKRSRAGARVRAFPSAMERAYLACCA